MDNKTIKERCVVNSNKDNDTFVGIICSDGDVSVHFPIGFSISNSDREIRKDILALSHAIASTVGRKESSILKQVDSDESVFPFQAYLEIIYDFYARGYYTEQEILYHKSLHGKIDWNRTIKSIKPVIQNKSAYYLEFATKKNSIKDNEIISLIHEFCVYDSFEKIGWLFTSSVAKKPRIKFNEKQFLSVLRDKLSKTYNDKNRLLFNNMISIIKYLGDNDCPLDYKYGTSRFEYVWETLIDRVFGVIEKSKFFPATYWKIDGKIYNNACLEPDTIMIYNDNFYVLDAKYYKYGITKNPFDLPESTSINKQITYGEYISQNESFRNEYGRSYKVYNAFLMPFDGKSDDDGFMIKAAIGFSTWKSGEKEYENIQGILIDTKSLIRNNVRLDKLKIGELAKLLETN